MMRKYADAQIAAMALKTTENITRNQLRTFRATAIAVAAGLVTIQRGGDEISESVGYPLLVPGIPNVGDDLLCIDVGGAPVVLGVLGNAATNQPRIGQVYTKPDSASAATTSSTTSDATWSTVRAFTRSDLPDGEYTISVNWDAQFSDTASQQLNYRANIGANTGTTFTLSVGTARERVGYTQENTGVVVSGGTGVTITVQYKRNAGATAGTASARNPKMVATATRTGV